MGLLDRQERARELTRRAGCDVMLVADPGSVWWLTGVAVPIETGPSPFAPPPVALVAGDGRVKLVVSEDDAPEHAPPGVELTIYEGFTVGALRGPETAARIVAEAVDGRRVAGERRALLPGPWQADAVVDVSAELLAARAVKHPDELDAVRAALRASDAGQRRLREVVAVGMTELELFAEIRASIEAEAGERTPLLADLVSGGRTAEMGGPPTNRTLGEGDLVLCDLAPRVRGAWADSCSTVAVGGAAQAHCAPHARVREALNRALDMARPGVRAADLDAAVRHGLDYPHHTGHGIGGSYHEQPRIVPDADTVLAPGMVIAVEPAHYQTIGIRLEHVLLINHDGAEDLSGHALEL